MAAMAEQLFILCGMMPSEVVQSANFEIDAKKSGKWGTVSKGQTIGHKHIIPVQLYTKELRFRCTESLDGKVKIREFAVY